MRRIQYGCTSFALSQATVTVYGTTAQFSLLILKWNVGQPQRYSGISKFSQFENINLKLKTTT